MSILKKKSHKNKKPSTNRNKKRKLPISASHLVLYGALLLYILTGIFGIVLACIMLYTYPEYTVQIVIALFSFVGVCGTASIGFYSTKAKDEHKQDADNRKYEKRLTMAKEIFVLLNNEKLSPIAINLLKDLISDSETSITTNSYGDNTISTIDAITYGVNDTEEIPQSLEDNVIQ